MRRVLVHAFVAGGFCVLLLSAAAAVGVYREEARRRQSAPLALRRAAAGAAVATLWFGPLVGGVGAMAGAGVGVVRNVLDRRRARKSHRWAVGDD